MDFNKSVLDKINNSVRLTREFDLDFKAIIDLPNNTLDEKNIEKIIRLTQNYLAIRKEHGSLLVMMNSLINSANESVDVEASTGTDADSEYLRKMYDISTFSTIISNISDLVNNIDFQYKKIALKYPKYINRKQIKIVLLTETDDNDDESVKLYNEIRARYPENIYKILKYTDKDIKAELKKLLNQDIKLKQKKTPILYIVNESNIIQIPLDKIKDIQTIKNILG